jgi:hypothetical protein
MHVNQASAGVRAGVEGIQDRKEKWDRHQTDASTASQAGCRTGMKSQTDKQGLHELVKSIAAAVEWKCLLLAVLGQVLA